MSNNTSLKRKITKSAEIKNSQFLKDKLEVISFFEKKLASEINSSQLKSNQFKSPVLSLVGVVL